VLKNYSSSFSYSFNGRRRKKKEIVDWVWTTGDSEEC
jgi:hypothetical protein